jgi:hypothetical protein
MEEKKDRSPCLPTTWALPIVSILFGRLDPLFQARGAKAIARLRGRQPSFATVPAEVKSSCAGGGSPAVSFCHGRESQARLSKHLFVRRALRQSVR